MREYYEKYHDRVEFVSVDCDEPEAKWRGFLAKNDMPWLHVMEGGTEYDLSDEYCVKAYPSKFILDAEYRIVAEFVGEGDDFYEKLDELMSK